MLSFCFNLTSFQDQTSPNSVNASLLSFFIYTVLKISVAFDEGINGVNEKAACNGGTKLIQRIL